MLNQVQYDGVKKNRHSGLDPESDPDFSRDKSKGLG